jgi:hypothetical protein
MTIEAFGIASPAAPDGWVICDVKYREHTRVLGLPDIVIIYSIGR